MSSSIEEPSLASRDPDAMLRRRRAWLAAGVVAVAASAGVGWHLSNKQSQSSVADRAAAGSAFDLWQLRFAQPAGGELVMAGLRGKPLVLNFWASWCAPCVREMPELDRFHRSFGSRGWQVVGLAIDGEEAVVQFLDRVRVGFPVALGGLGGTDLMKRLGNDKGGLPFTVVFNSDGAPVRRHIGETNYAQLEAWAAGVS